MAGLTGEYILRLMTYTVKSVFLNHRLLIREADCGSVPLSCAGYLRGYVGEAYDGEEEEPIDEVEQRLRMRAGQERLEKGKSATME